MELGRKVVRVKKWWESLGQGLGVEMVIGVGEVQTG